MASEAMGASRGPDRLHEFRGAVAVTGVVAIVLLTFSPAARGEIDCTECHGKKGFEATDAEGRHRSLYVDAGTFSKSIHGSIDCQDCHAGISAVPHPAKLPAVDCASCHDDVADTYRQHGGRKETPGDLFPACHDCHGTHDILPASDAASHVAPRNLPRTCARCHENPAIVKQYHIPMTRPVEAFETSVHARLAKGKNEPAASCVDCHSSAGTGHNVGSLIDPDSTIYHFNIPKTCGKCHEEIASSYEQGIHGLVASRGETDAPICTDCHGDHLILSASDPRSPVYPTKVSTETCGPCHGSELLNLKYGLPTRIMESWRTSYHGLKSTDGDPEVANCGSCHEAHGVRPASDPESSVNPANLEKTCGACHRGISKTIYRIPIHGSTGIALNRTGVILRNIYVVAIAVIIGLMAIHWLIDLQKRIRKLNHEEQIRRMRRDEVWQHTLVMVSFTVLVVTGFTFHYSGAWWVKLLFGWEGGFKLRGILHRVAGLMFVGVSVWHVVYLTSARGRQFLRDIFPARSDFVQFAHTIAYNLGRRREEPRFGRFSYIEKAEYWALVWGTVVMVITGFGLWFGNLTQRFLPVNAIGVMLVVHFMEAILAGLAILIWHLYSTIFNPPVYPNNPSWYTGKMPAEMYAREHPDDPAVREWLASKRDAASTGMGVSPQATHARVRPAPRRRKKKQKRGRGSSPSSS